ncbi:hypothetical protein [Antarcticimicrobium luteum]|uniref:PH domain-containing protein n=1 Tax=Antarcticimicrobium luteum TaxID=2547397 RepID=A0A4R5VGB8_9RHOB|nr:hypothetical protein [Antarcticimicrobium luteum]TDK51587.1 hypothetical protein E1832_03015 [Antarcticimicrobium luteum]
MEDDILMTVKVSAMRRWLGVGVLLGFGGLLVYVAFATPPALAWQGFLLAIGAGALWLAEMMRRGTSARIELTRTELRSSDGTRIAAIDEIEGLERGVFAFKPSNGFLIRTRAPGVRTWRPGLWWRLGRRVGIGGVTAAAQTKAMSEVLSALLAERD